MEKLSKVMSAQTAADMLKEAVFAGQDSDPFQAVVDAVQDGDAGALPLAIMGLVNDFCARRGAIFCRRCIAGGQKQ
jgi:hypothetical protein